jgi:hypothetical protein
MEVLASDFAHHRTAAQQLHQSGAYADANRHWRAAQDAAPDTLSRASALRGEASSTFRSGTSEVGIALAEHALSAHLDVYDAQVQDSGESKVKTEVLREVPESARVLGRMLLMKALHNEQKTGQPASPLLFDAGVAFGIGDKPVELLHKRTPGVPDQHEINWWPTRAVAEALLPDGDKAKARQWAGRAWNTARFSESEALPTAARISPEHAAKAGRIARARAAAANVIVRLATPYASKRRQVAVWLATRAKLI